ncbi:MAG TPA: hypothetical protein VH164_11235 [Ktedonobacteraceae bacterium]|nr:hypothetical protein [Ktedonobacteraceae bacterium]
MTADRVLDLKRCADDSGDDFDEIVYMEALEALSATEYAKFTKQTYGF